MKVIVTGSREFADHALVWSVLDELYDDYDGLILVHGDCPTGADRHADDWARSRQNDTWHIRIEPHPPDYGRYGSPRAQHIRNAEIAHSGATLVLAFFAPPPATNNGTAECVKLARRAGIAVREYGRKSAEEQPTLFD
jgi:hypothetical protein